MHGNGHPQANVQSMSLRAPPKPGLDRATFTCVMVMLLHGTYEQHILLLDHPTAQIQVSLEQLTGHHYTKENCRRVAVKL